MKFFIAFAALVALSVAGPLHKPADADLAQFEAIIAAINSPNTDPATAALLEEQLNHIIAAINPIAVGPAIVPDTPEPVEVGPIIIPHPAPESDNGAVTAPVAPSPVVVGDTPSDASPLVQIIVNIKQAAEASPIAVNPVVVPEVQPTPVQVVEVAPEPVQVVEVAPEPVQVVEVAPTPIQVVEVAPAPVEPVQVGVPVLPIQVIEVAPAPAEPVQIGVPVLPEAAVVLPEELN